MRYWFRKIVLLKSMSSAINMDGGIGLDVHVKAKRPNTLTVAQGLSPLDWGQERRMSRSSSISVLAMARKTIIGGAPNGDWYGVHVMDGSGSLRE